MRAGNFTSSDIYRLLAIGKRDMTYDELAEHKKMYPKSKKRTIECWPGEAALTYIDEKKMEIELGRPLDVGDNGKACIWGKFIESRAFSLLGLNYKLCSDETLVNKSIPFHCGTPDGINYGKTEEDNAVVDIKCPFTLESFARLVRPIYYGLTGMDAMNALRCGFTDKSGFEHKKHSDGEKYYQQLVSNAILTNTKYAELIIYVPYQSELVEIRESASNYEGDQNKIAWINWATDNDLPYLINGGFYRNINIIRFEVPQADKDALTARVREAGKLLIQN